MADFSLNGYDYTIGEYDTTGFYTVVPYRQNRTLTSYQSLTNAYVSIDGVMTPMVQYNGNYYIIRSLRNCFLGCYAMTSVPSIPKTVVNLSYCFYDCTALNQLITIPSSVQNMSGCFYGCTSLNQPITIPNSVLSMSGTFEGCTSLNKTINIPNSVQDMYRCFYGCTSLNQSITIPDSVRTITDCFNGCTSLNKIITLPNNINTINFIRCFYGCTSLNQPIVIPNSAKWIESCFYGCTSLNQPIVIPNSITDMSYCFYGCTSFNQQITIPENVTNMSYCFFNCKSFNQQIVIPSGVTDISGCFGGCLVFNHDVVIPSSVTDMAWCFNFCRALNSDIYVLSNQIRYLDAFGGTSEQIILHTYNTTLATSNLPSNVIVGTSPIYTMLNSRKLTTTENATYNTTHGVRVDMLLDTSLSGAIIGSTAPLYDLEDNEIDLSWYNAPNGLLRCYAIIDAPIQVPSSSLVVGVECVTPEQLYGSIGYPCTTESVQIEYNGDNTEILAPYITSENVRFNPKNLQRASNIYNVRDMIALVARESPADVVGKPFSRVQLNNIENNNVNAQHVVTCADNVYNGSRTVQEVITALYNRY